MKATASIILLAATAFISLSAGSTENMNADKTLQGTWSCVSATVDGRALPPETVAKLRLTLTETRYKTEKGEELLFDSTYNVDASVSPRQINMVGTEGELAGKEAQGIYAVNGDELRICYRMPGLGRPIAFESSPGSKSHFVTWKRKR